MQTPVMALVGNMVGFGWPETLCAKFSRIDRVPLAGMVTSETVTVPGLGKSVNVQVGTTSGPGCVAPLGNWIDPHCLKPGGVQSTSIDCIVNASGDMFLRSSFN